MKKINRKLIVTGIIICFCLSVFSQKPLEKKDIQSAFDPEKAGWDISWPGRVSRHDLVYLTPPVDPMQGIPLGNGEIGALFWCEGSKIMAAVNKSDLWDDAAPGHFHNWSKKEEDHSTTLRHACRVIIDFKFPVFDVMYLSGFEARLNLKDASLDIKSQTPFGEIKLKAFVDHETGILFYDLKTDLNENTPLEVAVERFGSRTYSHWYSQINRDASIGIDGTGAFADSDGVFIDHKLTRGTFAVGASVIQSGGLAINYLREHSHRAVIQLSGNQKKEAQLAFAVTSPKTANPVPELKNTLSLAKEKGMGTFMQSQTEIWESIWGRSFMDYGDDYLNNLWYLTMYYANASQGGNYPGRFTNGLWGWSRDVQNWNFYFHWNQQELYWPLNAAGHHGLVGPYLDFRFNSLPHAKKDAKELLGTSGAFISDVTDRRGYNSAGEKHNHTPIAEIALDFWRQYKFTCDKDFLKEKALPFIIEASRFYQSLFEKGTDGLYHAKEGTGYEGWIKLKDGLTELTYARALFSAALEALEETGTKLPEAEKWEDILEHLAPLPVVEAEKGAIARKGSSFILGKGFFKGGQVPGNKIMAAGWGIKEKEWLKVYNPVADTAINNGLKLLDGIFPSVPSSPVFPSGVIGLGQKGSEQFQEMKTTALLYGSEVTGWDPVPIVLARLGLTEELKTGLGRFPSRWQIYCNGWGHWGLEGEVNKDAGSFFRTNTVRDVNSEEKFQLPMWPFRHMSMESMSVLATAMNESLLQSYDGVLRVFPAAQNGRFTLHAQGGFVVSAEKVSGEVQWICIQSLHGKPCKLQLPWDGAVFNSSLRNKNNEVRGELAGFKTKAGEVIMVYPQDKKIEGWIVLKEESQKNKGPKFHSSGKAQLGLPKMF